MLEPGVRPRRCVRHGIWCVQNKPVEVCVRTNIVSDDKLMTATLKATGAKTKREVGELG